MLKITNYQITAIWNKVQLTSIVYSSSRLHFSLVPKNSMLTPSQIDQTSTLILEPVILKSCQRLNHLGSIKIYSESSLLADNG